MGRFSKLETNTGPVPPPSAAPEAEAPSSGTEAHSYDTTVREADRQFQEGAFRKSLRLYSRALQFDHSRLEPWLGQVLALLLLGEVREAAVWSQRALEAFPEHPIVISLRGLCYCMQGMAQRGLGSSDYALNKGASEMLCWLMRGWMLLAADNENWRGCLSKAAGMCPPDGWRHHQLMGLVLESFRKWPQAYEAYRRALEGQTSNAFLWARTALTCERLGLTRQAIEACEHALALQPGHPEAERVLSRLTGLWGWLAPRRLLRLFGR
jgi:tetratricopeptide (TPR) repeat protein